MEADAMTGAVEKNTYTGIHSILISKGGKLVYEHYFNGWGRDSLHDSRSSFKSVTSLLTGIAIDNGFIKDVGQKVYSFFPDYAPFGNDDPRKKEMTIKNLLEMESGFDCEEFNDRKDCESAMDETADWVKFSLDLPMKDAPGTVWAYTSCDPVIISGIIRKTRSYQRNVLFASGNGGQYFMIIKDMDMVVVFTQGNYNSWKAKTAFDLLAKYILPAYIPAHAD